jgi:hypothetical protein
MISPLADNPAGFWENVDFMTLSEEILNLFGGWWDQPPVLDANKLKDNPTIAKLGMRAQELARSLAGSMAWGWKDPRNCLTLPFWRRVIPHLQVVACIRNPLDVALSLQKRGHSSISFGLNLWLTYNENLLSNTTPEERIVTHYDSYFEDPQRELGRVLNLLGFSVPKKTIANACGTVDRALRHSCSTREDMLKAEVSPTVLAVYDNLCVEAGPVFLDASP